MDTFIHISFHRQRSAFDAGGFQETELGEVRFPEISTPILEKLCQFFYYKLRYTNRWEMLGKSMVFPFLCAAAMWVIGSSWHTNRRGCSFPTSYSIEGPLSDVFRRLWGDGLIRELEHLEEEREGGYTGIHVLRGRHFVKVVSFEDAPEIATCPVRLVACFQRPTFQRGLLCIGSGASFAVWKLWMGVNGSIQNTRISHQSNCEYLGVSWFSPFVWSCVLLVSGIFCFPLLLESNFEDASC